MLLWINPPLTFDCWRIKCQSLFLAVHKGASKHSIWSSTVLLASPPSPSSFTGSWSIQSIPNLSPPYLSYRLHLSTHTCSLRFSSTSLFSLFYIQLHATPDPKETRKDLGRKPNPTTRRLIKLSGTLAWSCVREAHGCLGDAADTLTSLDKPGLHLPKRNKCLLEKVHHLEKDGSSCVLLLQKMKVNKNMKLIPEQSCQAWCSVPMIVSGRPSSSIL